MGIAAYAMSLIALYLAGLYWKAGLHQAQLAREKETLARDYYKKVIILHKYRRMAGRVR